jgi:hypothetical protein
MWSPNAPLHVPRSELRKRVGALRTTSMAIDWSAHHASASASLPSVVASVVRRGSSRRAVQSARQHVHCHLWLRTAQQQAAAYIWSHSGVGGRCTWVLLCGSGGVTRLPSTTGGVDAVRGSQWSLGASLPHTSSRVHCCEGGVKRGQLRPAPLSFSGQMIYPNHAA